MQTILTKQISAVKPIQVACVGGGQLGRMMALEAPRLGIEMSFLDPLGNQCPAAKVVPKERVIQGALNDPKKLRELASKADVVTVESFKVAPSITSDMVLVDRVIETPSIAKLAS